MESKKIRKRNTTNVFLTWYEFPYLCEAEDTDIVMTPWVQRRYGYCNDAVSAKISCFFFTRGIDADSSYIIRSKFNEIYMQVVYQMNLNFSKEAVKINDGHFC